MRIFDSKPALRWLAPVALVAVVGGTGLLASTATAEDKLAPRTGGAAADRPAVGGRRRAVRHRGSAGRPRHPGDSGAGGNGAELTSLISGTHTLRVWYSGPDKARVALLDTGDETDVITNGKDVWTWSHSDQAATHRTINRDATGSEQRKPSGDLPEDA